MCESFGQLPHFESSGCWAGLGWAGLGWAGLGCAGWAGLVGWAGLGWAGLGWAGLGLGRGCCWAVRLAGCWGGLGWADHILGAWATLKRIFENETEIGFFENGKGVFPSKNGLPDGQQQQAISIYFFLEDLGFRF